MDRNVERPRFGVCSFAGCFPRGVVLALWGGLLLLGVAGCSGEDGPATSAPAAAGNAPAGVGSAPAGVGSAPAAAAPASAAPAAIGASDPQAAAGAGGMAQGGPAGPGSIPAPAGAPGVATAPGDGPPGIAGAPDAAADPADAAGEVAVGPGGAGMASDGEAMAGEMAGETPIDPEGASTPSGACTRESLTAVVDQYFAALVAHDPSQLALAPEVKFTENAKSLDVGEGLWTTASELTFHRNLLDPERCGSLTQAVLEEDGEGPIIFGVRLKLVAQQITEIETYIARSTEFFQTPEGVPVMDGEEWESILEPAERSTREELNAAADAYFDFFADQSAPVPFATPCDRWENGFRTTRGDCSNLGGAGGLRMTHRRYPVADVEAGVAVGFILFAGSLLDFHMFKVRNGEITQIQALVGPTSTTTGWEEQEE